MMEVTGLFWCGWRGTAVEREYCLAVLLRLTQAYNILGMTRRLGRVDRMELL